MASSRENPVSLQSKDDPRTKRVGTLKSEVFSKGQIHLGVLIVAPTKLRDAKKIQNTQRMAVYRDI